MSDISERVLEAFLDRRTAQGGSGDSYFRERIRGYRDATDGNALYLHGNLIAVHVDSVRQISSYDLVRIGESPDVNIRGNIIVTLSGHNTLTTRNRLNDLIDAWSARRGGPHPGDIYTQDGYPLINSRDLATDEFYALDVRPKDVIDPQRAFESILNDLRLGSITIERDKRYHSYYSGRSVFKYDSPKKGKKIKRGERALHKLRAYYKAIYYAEDDTWSNHIPFLKNRYYLFPSVVLDKRIRRRTIRTFSNALSRYDYLSQMLIDMPD